MAQTVKAIMETSAPLGLSRDEAVAFRCLAAGESFRDLDDAQAFLQTAFRGWFVYRGGNHVSLHRASGQPRLLVVEAR